MDGFIADNGSTIEYFLDEGNAKAYGQYAPCIIPDGVIPVDK